MIEKVDESTNFRKSKQKVRITFGTTQKFRHVVAKYAVSQGFDLTIEVFDPIRKRIIAMCKQAYSFKVYASWDKRKMTYVVRTVKHRHRCRRDMLNNQIPVIGKILSNEVQREAGLVLLKKSSTKLRLWSLYQKLESI